MSHLRKAFKQDLSQRSSNKLIRVIRKGTVRHLKIAYTPTELLTYTVWPILYLSRVQPITCNYVYKLESYTAITEFFGEYAGRSEYSLFV